MIFHRPKRARTVEKELGSDSRMFETASDHTVVRSAFDHTFAFMSPLLIRPISHMIRLCPDRCADL